MYLFFSIVMMLVCMFFVFLSGAAAGRMPPIPQNQNPNTISALMLWCLLFGVITGASVIPLAHFHSF